MSRVNGFVERNRDALPTEIMSLMNTSNNAILKQVYGTAASTTAAAVTSSSTTSSSSSSSSSSTSSPAPADSSRRVTGGGGRGGGGGGASAASSKRSGFFKADTVTTKFRAQLEKLMQEISLTNVQYVRCIKPNAIKSNAYFDRRMVLCDTHSIYDRYL